MPLNVSEPSSLLRSGPVLFCASAPPASTASMTTAPRAHVLIDRISHPLFIWLFVTERYISSDTAPGEQFWALSRPCCHHTFVIFACWVGRQRARRYAA